MRSALELVHAAQDPASVEDGWKLFLLAPRMLLHRKRGQSHVPPAELARRAELLGSRRWCQLLDEAAQAADAHPERPANPRSRPTRAEPEDDAQRRADRAVALAHLGELSAARTAVEAAPLAPSTDETIAALRDPTKRPQTRQVPLPDWLSNFQPEGGCTPLDLNKFCGNLRGARRGAAAGPSACTAEHMRVMLDDEACTELLGFAAQRLADADVPASVLEGLRVGRMVALRKQSGGIRGLVMADVFRHLVSRTLAQQAATAFQESCAPFQYALSTRAGAEALVRGLGLSTELSARATVASVDGVGAYDHVSRAAMFEGLRRDNRLAGLIPFVRQFYGQESSYLFYDAFGRAHDVLQAEGGEQGDLLMPGLFAVAIHPALVATQTALRGGERLYAFLDDAYLTCDPERLRATFLSLRQALKSHANIDLNVGKTRVWNAAGEEPPGLSEWMPPAQDGSPVWVGDPTLPPELQGILVLGTPWGTTPSKRQRCLPNGASTIRSWINCQASQTSKRPGCISSCARAPAATICSGRCSHPSLRISLPATTVRSWAA